MKASEFKELIKEAVREVVKEELKGIKIALKEHNNILQPYKKIGVSITPSSPPKNPYVATGLPIEERMYNQQIPTHTERKDHTNYQTTGNPLIDLLNETKYNTSAEDWQNFGGFNSSQAQGYSSPQNINSEPAVGTVGDMLQTAPKTNDINAISIDVVPNFSNLMGELKNRGQI